MTFVRQRPYMVSSLFGLLLLIASVYAVRQDASLWMMETSSDAGFVLTDISITGLGRTQERDVQAVLDIDSGMPLLAIDLVEIQSRVEALPWVKEAVVNRVLPGSVSIELEERVPFALSQVNGRVALIDRDGVTITDRGLGEYRELMLVVGEATPELLHQLEELTSVTPQLANRIRSAVRINGRRWDLLFRNGVRVKLPSEMASGYDMTQAWTRFENLNQKHRLLEREVSVIDLRLHDRLIVRVTPAGRRQLAGEEWML